METDSTAPQPQVPSPRSYLSRIMGLLFAPYNRHQYFFNLVNWQAANIINAITEQPKPSQVSQTPLIYTKSKTPSLKTMPEELANQVKSPEVSRSPSPPLFITIPDSPQTLKNKFINDAEGQTSITTPIKQAVKNAIDQMDITTASLDNSALFQSINKLKNNGLILPEKLDEALTQEKSLGANINESYLSSFGSAFSLFKSSSNATKILTEANEERHFENISAPLITMLVLSDEPQKTAEYLIRFHQRTLLSENITGLLQTIDEDSLLSLYELNKILEILYTKAERTGDAQADFEYIIQCETVDEIQTYIDSLDDLKTETKKELEYQIVDYSKDLISLFGN